MRHTYSEVARNHELIFLLINTPKWGKNVSHETRFDAKRSGLTYRRDGEKGREYMNAIFIEGKRNGYGPDQCGRTLTVGELIEILEEFDSDRPVFLRNDNGYTYGSITERDINTAENLGYGEEDEDE